MVFLLLHQSRASFLLLQRICTFPMFPTALCSPPLCELLGKLITCSRTFCQKAQPRICQLLSISRRSSFQWGMPCAMEDEFFQTSRLLQSIEFFRLQGFCNPSPFRPRPHMDSLVSGHSQISYGACPSYWNSTSSLTMTSFFVFLPMLPMHCFSELMKNVVIGNISGRSWFALIPNRANPRLLSSSAGMVRWYPTPTARIPQPKPTRFTISSRPLSTHHFEPDFPRPLPIYLYIS